MKCKKCGALISLSLEEVMKGKKVAFCDMVKMPDSKTLKKYPEAIDFCFRCWERHQ